MREPWCSVDEYQLRHELLACALEEWALTWAGPLALVAEIDATVAQAVKERLLDQWIADNADAHISYPPTILRKICAGVLQFAAIVDLK